LETICLKCLQKEPPKRYPGAEALADDLVRFLAAQPVHARPVSGAERLWRWCRRRPVIAGLTAAVGLLLVAGTGTTTYFAVQADSRARDAGEQKERAEAAERKKDEQLQLAERRLYGLQIASAQRELEIGNVGHAEEVLAECRADLRSFEHYYLGSLCQRRVR